MTIQAQLQMLQQECFHPIRSHFKSVNNVLQRPQIMSGTRNESMPDCKPPPHPHHSLPFTSPMPRISMLSTLTRARRQVSQSRGSSLARLWKFWYWNWLLCTSTSLTSAPAALRAVVLPFMEDGLAKQGKSHVGHSKDALHQDTQSFLLPTLEVCDRFHLNQTGSVAHFFFTDDSRKIMETTRHCQNDDKS